MKGTSHYSHTPPKTFPLKIAGWKFQPFLLKWSLFRVGPLVQISGEISTHEIFPCKAGGLPSTNLQVGAHNSTYYGVDIIPGPISYPFLFGRGFPPFPFQPSTTVPGLNPRDTRCAALSLKFPPLARKSGAVSKLSGGSLAA